MSLWSFEGAVVSAFPSQFPVVIAAGVHLFPFRTEQLSPPAPMVLGGQPPGRVGRRRIIFERAARAARFAVWNISSLMGCVTKGRRFAIGLVRRSPRRPRPRATFRASRDRALAAGARARPPAGA